MKDGKGTNEQTTQDLDVIIKEGLQQFEVNPIEATQAEPENGTGKSPDVKKADDPDKKTDPPEGKTDVSSSAAARKKIYHPR